MGRKRKWGPQTFFLFYEFDGGGGGGGGGGQ